MPQNEPTPTERQQEQFAVGSAFHDGGFPRCAPHDESEWRWWLKGWDCAQMAKELDEHLAKAIDNDQ